MAAIAPVFVMILILFLIFKLAKWTPTGASKKLFVVPPIFRKHVDSVRFVVVGGKRIRRVAMLHGQLCVDHGSASDS